MASSFAADLAHLLGEAGTSATLRTYTEVFDPVAGTKTRTAADTSVSVSISSFTTEEIIGGLALRGDLKVTLAAGELEVAPTPAMTLVLDGAEWSIHTVTPRYAGGAVLSYVLQLRR